MREVEAQTTRLDERPRLASVVAEQLAERRVHDVGRGVSSGGGLAPIGIDLRVCLLARPDLARLDTPVWTIDRSPAGTVSVTRMTPEGVRISPRSPTWPPPSA